MKDTKFFEIYNIPNFQINRIGDIYRLDSNDNAIKIETMRHFSGVYVEINGDVFRVDYLMLKTFYGPLTYKGTEFVDGDIFNLNISNIKYIIDDIVCYNLPRSEIIINGEIFRQIKGYHNYYINKSGVIFSTHINRMMRYKDNKGYRIIQLSSHETKKKKWLKIHRLVYSTWYNVDLVKDDIIHHKNNVKHHNHLDNLELTDILGNTRRAINDNIKSVPYSYDIVYKICEMDTNNNSVDDIIHTLNLSVDDRSIIISLLYRIKKREVYNDIYDKLGMTDNTTSRNTLSPKEVHEICDLLVNTNISRRRISKLYDVGINTIWKIHNGVTWKNITKQYQFPENRKYAHISNEGSTTRES